MMRTTPAIIESFVDGLKAEMVVIGLHPIADVDDSDLGERNVGFFVKVRGEGKGVLRGDKLT